MKILIIDDNPAVRSTLNLILADEFDDITASGDPRIIPALLRNGDIDCVILDMNFNSNKLDGSDGLFWLERIKESPNAPAVVVITAFGEIGLAVEAMKLGAEDFVTKPWNNDELIEKLHKAIVRNKKTRIENKAINNAAALEQREHDRQKMTLDEVKMQHIKEVISQCDGNLSAAAERLNINRQTLYNLLKKS
ncbi:MAG: response regulator [Muribaculaceae bacterium]|nr:response regulator [Muribaculaceae bacterium]MDE5844953.1 response regulator [Muribaculaceae bacterium]